MTNFGLQPIDTTPQNRQAMSTIVGRDAELLAGDSFLKAAANGTALLVLRGEPGIGKTTIWAAIADRAEAAGCVVLRAQPSVAETSLTLAALADLLETVPVQVVEDLPPPQRRAIDAALMRTEPTTEALARTVLGTAVRSVLRGLSETAPVVIAIDDAQWLDPASAGTLGYALRRLGDARIGLLVALRAGEPSPIDLKGIPAAERWESQIGPMSLGALHHLLAARLGHAPARSTLVRIHETSLGNPFFAVEIARRLQEIGEPLPGQPLPVPPDVKELLRQRIHRLPAATREALLTIAAQRDPTRASVGAALGRQVESDLETAEREEIIRVEDDAIRFSHPLFAGAIYADAGDADRRATHERLARTVEGVEKRARHLALAANGPDEAVAAMLEEAAHAAAARGAPLAAADLLRLALNLTPDGEAAARDQRTVALGESLKRAGDTAQAERVLATAVATASTAHARARARLALANVVVETDATHSTGRMVAEALSDAVGDAELLVYAHAMYAAVEYVDRRLAREHAREAKRLLDELVNPSPIVESVVLYTYVGLEFAAGEPLPMDLVDRALALERTAPSPVVSDRLSASLGLWLLMADDFDGARRWIEATLAAAIEEGDEGSLPYALQHPPALEFTAGNWDLSEDYARRGLAASLEIGQDANRQHAMCHLATVYAHQGREDEARSMLAELFEGARAAGSLWSESKALAVLGALELSLGNGAAAAAHLLLAEAQRDQIGDAAPRRHDADLVEALVAAGDLERARNLVEIIEERARRFNRHSRIAVATRARAIVAAASGRLDDAIRSLEEALREHDLAPIAFDRARTELVLGRVHRRRRERALAKQAFERALATFEQLGARIWAELARADLDRVGLRRGSGSELTEGERRVAELVASGRTVGQAASLLFMSHRTAESNLSRAYRKLGVGSRAELGAAMAATPVTHGQVTPE
jgi:DNA-binding CsgD family transcriptional regulator